MKKLWQHSFLFFLLLTCIVIVPTTLVLQSCTTDEPETTVTTTEATTTSTTTTTTVTTTTAPTTTTTSVKPSTSKKPSSTVTFPDASEKISFPGVLFIGDSRTVGLRDYGKTSDATFFCSVGLSSNNVTTKAVSVSGYGDITLGNLLKKKQFDTVYIMLGINEIGGSLSGIANKYQKIIDLVHGAQPNAIVVVQSTLHVTQKRNQQEVAKKGYFNNERIDNLNSHLQKLANGTTVRYLDMNPMFDDEHNCLMAEAAAGDGIHIKAKYYLLWRKYLDENRIA